ncbi:ABC transporter permease [Vibrio metschnikovii]|nr:ABC transporter permease [Vibrio metschnikovii]
MTSVQKRSPLKIWKDVIFAIFLRDIKSKFSDKLGVSWSVVAPLLFIMLLTLIRGHIDGGETHTMPTYFFMAFGILYVRFFMEAVSSVSNSIKANQALFAFRQVQPISAFIASAMFELLSKFFVAILVIIIGYFLGVPIFFDNILGMALCFLLVWLLSISVAVLFSLAQCYISEVSKIKSFLLRPVIFVSGAFFSLRDLPPEYWKYFTWNPILHAIELTRYYATPTYGYVGVSLSYLTVMTIFLFFISLCCYQALWKGAISR